MSLIQPKQNLKKEHILGILRGSHIYSGVFTNRTILDWCTFRAQCRDEGYMAHDPIPLATADWTDDIFYKSINPGCLSAHYLFRPEIVVRVVRTFPSPPGVCSRVVRVNMRAFGRYATILITTAIPQKNSAYIAMAIRVVNSSVMPPNIGVLINPLNGATRIPVIP